jgi:hypothetical protein
MSDAGLYRTDDAPCFRSGSVRLHRAAQAARDVACRVHRAWSGWSARRASIRSSALVAILPSPSAAGAAGALNMWYDADIDRLMGRTAKRPIPAGKVTGEEALDLRARAVGLRRG